MKTIIRKLGEYINNHCVPVLDRIYYTLCLMYYNYK